MQFSVYPFVAHGSCVIHLVVCSKSDIVIQNIVLMEATAWTTNMNWTTRNHAEIMNAVLELIGRLELVQQLIWKF